LIITQYILQCAQLAESAKRKGNAAFAKGEYLAAIKGYSMVSLQPLILPGVAPKALDPSL